MNATCEGDVVVPWKVVTNYRLGYKIANQQFLVYYELAGESNVYQFSASPEQFTALSSLFREEGPVHFNTDVGYFVTGPEPVGEGEL